MKRIHLHLAVLAALLLQACASTPQTVIQGDHFLPVSGIVNARNLGGYTVQDGRTVREDAFIRAAHLADATDSDISYLADIPVTRIIDFRKDDELPGKADRPVPGAEYIRLPIDASGNAMAQATDKEKKKFTGRKKFDIKKFIVFAAFNDKAMRVAEEMYPTLLFNPECQQQYRTFFRELLDEEDGAVLYHCTQGKDRTGIASALILAALGADRATIVEDFDTTNKVYEQDVEKYSRRVKFWGGKEENIAVVKSLLGANTENFVKALDRVDSEYGSLEAYLEQVLGVSEADRKALQDKYLR